MGYLPKWLASKFGYFSTQSIMKIWGWLFGAMLVMVLIIPLVSYMSELLVFPLVSVYLIFITGVMSAKFYARKPIILTDPIAVKLSATDAGEKIVKVGKLLVEIVFFLFVYLMLVSSFIAALMAFIALF